MTRRAVVGGALACPLAGLAAAEELAGLDLAAASALVRRRTVSPVELTRACLARIERLDPVLSAFVTVTSELALAQAAEAEAEIRRGDWRGPLHGIPVALKDLVDTAGVRTTAGSAVFADRVPASDAAVVRRLRDAGAILLGKLDTHEFAFGVTSVFTHFGPVHNPWDPTRIAGGSSGGSAVAAAAGLAYATLGTDTGGSIRQPAAYCGVVGLKPTYGRVSNRGVIPLSPSLDHVGPLTRTVADAALVLQVIAGFDAEDPTSVDAPALRWLRHWRGPFRVGVPRTPFYEGLAPEVAAAVEAALGVLVDLGAELRELTWPAHPDLTTYRTVTTAEAYAYHASWIAERGDLYQPPVLQRIRTGSEVTTAAYLAARTEVARARNLAGELLAGVDVVATPTTVDLPVPVADVLAGAVVPAPPRNTYPFNLYGLPAVSVPCGFTDAGLPVGLQLAGAPWSEPALLAIASAYEAAGGWKGRTPPIAGG